MAKRSFESEDYFCFSSRTQQNRSIRRIRMTTTEKCWDRARSVGVRTIRVVKSHVLDPSQGRARGSSR